LPLSREKGPKGLLHGDWEAGYQPLRSRLDGGGLFFILVGLLMFVVLPDATVGPVNQLFGAMATGVGMVLQYFFGSSKGIADKTAGILELRQLAATVGKE